MGLQIRWLNPWRKRAFQAEVRDRPEGQEAKTAEDGKGPMDSLNILSGCGDSEGVAAPHP